MTEHLNDVESLYSYTELPMTRIFRGTWCDTPKVWTWDISSFYEIEYIYRNDLEFPYHEEE